MEGHIERESGLGGLFQQIIQDMKVSRRDRVKGTTDRNSFSIKRDQNEFLSQKSTTITQFVHKRRSQRPRKNTIYLDFFPPSQKRITIEIIPFGACRGLPKAGLSFVRRGKCKTNDSSADGNASLSPDKAAAVVQKTVFWGIVTTIDSQILREMCESHVRGRRRIHGDSTCPTKI
jgi:hypothetical protein